MPRRKRVLSGMRPTGRLHIGHYFGALDNWIKLQNDPAYECFFFVADWHALTTDYADTSQIAQNTIEIGIDWLAAGLDPAKCTLFVQSQVPEHAELHLLLSMITPLGWLERVPTYKEQMEQMQDKDLDTHGFLGYPLLQTADIVMYGDPSAGLSVPVGEDQVPHIEMAREVVRKFNYHFGFTLNRRLFLLGNEDAFLEVQRIVPNPEYPSRIHPGLSAEALWEMNIRWKIEQEGVRNFFHKLEKARLFMILKSVLAEPDAQLTPTPRILGADGRKMSKSYRNALLLGEDENSIRMKIRGMVTDPARRMRTDKGNPDVCPVFSWHRLFSGQDTIARVNKECRTAEIGCVDCKGLMADALVGWIEPMRARRQEYETHPARVLEILDEGSKKARKVAQETMGRVREAVFGWKEKREELAQGAKPAARRD